MSLLTFLLSPASGHLAPFAGRQSAAGYAHIRAFTVAGFNVNRNRRFGKFFPDPAFQSFGDVVRIMHRHGRIYFNVKVYKTDLAGLSGTQPVEAVDRGFLSYDVPNQILFVRRELLVH